eukprot:TRINITY_DN4568_c0_g1_i1.p2 TRINITY_DN4568_c0_g1~~TRINITY_DN4568_c0_g1_i1.p2  ORF type:complete len:147 (+),score=34.13 TRINITY_DN4568_c0_g1_i1:4-444(+)
MQNSSSSSSMTGFKKVLWVRHAQGEHNVVAEHSGLDACRNPALWDARLTAHGHQQAAAAAAVHQAVLAKAEVVVVSPLSRCIETATAMMERACPGRRVAYVALEDVRESHGVDACACLDEAGLPRGVTGVCLQGGTGRRSGAAWAS